MQRREQWAGARAPRSVGQREAVVGKILLGSVGDWPAEPMVYTAGRRPFVDANTVVQAGAKHA